jgi:hypothetical protein
MAYNNNKGNYNNFDLNNYENVKSRKVRLRNDHPNAYIMPITLSDVNYSGNYILMGALIWKDKKTIEERSFDLMEKMAAAAEKATPQNIGVIMASIALLSGADGVGHSLSVAGGKGADKNAWVENAEESAVGRALDNMGYHSGSASQEEMKKVQHVQDALQNRVQLENQVNSLYGQLMAQGHNPQYLSQVVSQSVRPFNQLNELSPDELEKLVNALQSVGGQGAYQAQQQQYNNQPPSGAPNVPVPGAPNTRVG